VNKTELVKKIAEGADISNAEAKRALESFIACVTEELKEGGSISLVGFGTFSIRERAARTGRNPQTGAEINIAAAKVPTFKAGKALKEGTGSTGAAPDKNDVLGPIDRLLGVNGNSREWRYLNKGTHEEEDRSEFEHHTVIEVVSAIEALDQVL
jgi:DNA-binding protein HU-beta